MIKAGEVRLFVRNQIEMFSSSQNDVRREAAIYFLQAVDSSLAVMGKRLLPAGRAVTAALNDCTVMQALLRKGLAS